MAVVVRYWVVSEEDLLHALRRVAAGEDADLVYAEIYVNARRERIDENGEVIG